MVFVIVGTDPAEEMALFGPPEGPEFPLRVHPLIRVEPPFRMDSPQLGPKVDTLFTKVQVSKVGLLL